MRGRKPTETKQGDARTGRERICALNRRRPRYSRPILRASCPAVFLLQPRAPSCSKSIEAPMVESSALRARRRCASHHHALAPYHHALASYRQRFAPYRRGGIRQRDRPEGQSRRLAKLLVRRHHATRADGGGGGIRTHGQLSPSPVFKTGAFNHSATPPNAASLAHPLFRVTSWKRLPGHFFYRRGGGGSVGHPAVEEALRTALGACWKALGTHALGPARVAASALPVPDR